MELIEIKKRLAYAVSNNLFDAHYINDMNSLIELVAEKDKHIEILRDAKDDEIEHHSQTCLDYQAIISAKDTLIESQKEIIDGLADERHKLIDECDVLKNQLFDQKNLLESQKTEIEKAREIFETFLEWAKNDISIWGKVGQHVGTPKFISSSVAKDVKSITEFYLQKGTTREPT